jgi:hypothetical protein
MRLNRAFIVTLFAAFGVHATLAQTTRSPLFAAVNVAEYLGETYTNLPESGAAYVFFRTEPISLRITIANQTAQDIALNLSPATADPFEISATRDGQPFPIRTDVGAGERLNVGQPTPLTESPIVLSPRDSIDWPIRLPSNLPPGEYRVTVTANASDGQGRPLVWRADAVEFVLRPQSASSLAEETYRRAMRHYLSDSPQRLRNARNAANALLKVHPRSWAAYALIGRIAEEEGDTEASRRAYDAAGTIIENDEDTLLIRHKTKRQIDEMKANVRARRLKPQ